MEYQVCLNDLPGNDFNTLFMSLPKFHQQLKEETGLASGRCFVNAVPGSFYGRLFPCLSLDFVHSSYSLYWLSQVPMGLEENKRNIYMSSTSPQSVVQAYKDQFQKDTQMFLNNRSMELIAGGTMVLTYWGRSNENPTATESCFVWDFLARALNQLVLEGIIEIAKLETFNVPIYHASSTEVIEEVNKNGRFQINSIDVSQVKVNGQQNGDTTKGDPSSLMRAIFESVLVSHFGGEVTDEVFPRLTVIFKEATSKQCLQLTNVTVSLTKI